MSLAPEHEGQPRQMTISGEGEMDGHWYSPAAVREMIDALQIKIDTLMLEYCPKEMTTEQLARWGRHQQMSVHIVAIAQAVAAERAATIEACEMAARGAQYTFGCLPGQAVLAAVRAIRKLGQPLIQQISEETMALARRAVETQRTDKRTEAEIIRDGVRFVMEGPEHD